MSAVEDGMPGPDEAVELLLEGNERFAAGVASHPRQDSARRAALVAGQRPFAVVVACSDSRLAPEVVFDVGLGDLFVVRTAGQALGAEVLASIEFGVSVLGVNLVAVLGHGSCGAVGAAHDAVMGEPPEPHLRPIVDHVEPSVRAARAAGLTDLDEIGQVHVRRTVAAITDQGAVLARVIEAKRASIVGMFYHLAEGRVSVVTGEPGGHS